MAILRNCAADDADTARRASARRTLKRARARIKARPQRGRGHAPLAEQSLFVVAARLDDQGHTPTAEPRQGLRQRGRGADDGVVRDEQLNASGENEPQRQGRDDQPGRQPAQGGEGQGRPLDEAGVLPETLRAQAGRETGDVDLHAQVLAQSLPLARLARLQRPRVTHRVHPADPQPARVASPCHAAPLRRARPPRHCGRFASC